MADVTQVTTLDELLADVGAPRNIVEGTGAPVNPVAVK
jgi:hypothetical protein